MLISAELTTAKSPIAANTASGKPGAPASSTVNSAPLPAPASSLAGTSMDESTATAT
jgi:hypothetical protein